MQEELLKTHEVQNENVHTATSSAFRDATQMCLV
jgi:hypothetical protein